MKYEQDDAINDMVNISAVDNKIIESSTQQTSKMKSKIYNVTSREDGVTWGKWLQAIMHIQHKSKKNQSRNLYFNFQFRSYKRHNA